MAHRSSGTDIIRDLLETDVYNCSMINAALQLYPKARAWYTVVDRDHAIYPKGFAGLLTEKFQDLRSLSSDPCLRDFLREKWGFLAGDFFDWVEKYRFVPEYIQVSQDEEGHLFGKIIGPWSDIMFVEQIFIAVTSQTRNEELGYYPDDNWIDELLKNIWEMRAAGLKVSEFGLRRRAYSWIQDIVTENLIKYGGESYVGSSSPYHARMSGLSPKGTVAHLWYLFHGALYGVETANMAASVAWRAIYGDNLGTALPDTWGADFFFATLTPGMARLIKSYRHDSGDPITFATDVLHFLKYPTNDIDPATVTLMFTDSLSISGAKAIEKVVTRWFPTAYGIGGFWTNNKDYFKKTPAYTPLNMVVKPWAFDPFKQGEEWTKVAKVPDSAGKNVGDPDVIAKIMEIKSRHPFLYHF
jgi:nicotinate phosphoribosyltransferase